MVLISCISTKNKFQDTVSVTKQFCLQCCTKDIVPLGKQVLEEQITKRMWQVGFSKTNLKSNPSLLSCTHIHQILILSKKFIGIFS